MAAPLSQLLSLRASVAKLVPMPTPAKTPKQYLDALPPDRKKALAAVRKVIRANLPKGYEEGIQYGMIGYYVPHKIYPAGYHCDPKQPVPFASLASQKNHMAVYMMCLYGSPEQEAWFRKAWAKTGKKLDMGKSCIRFKKVEDLPLELIGEAIKRVPVKAYMDHYTGVLATMGKRKGRTATKAAPKKAAGKPATKKTARKKATRKAVARKAAAKKVARKTTSTKAPAKRKVTRRAAR